MSEHVWGEKSSYIDADNAGLCGWITTEVSHILLEELPGIVGWITNKLISKFETIEAARGRDLDTETHHRK